MNNNDNYRNFSWRIVSAEVQPDRGLTLHTAGPGSRKVGVAPEFRPEVEMTLKRKNITVGEKK